MYFVLGLRKDDGRWKVIAEPDNMLSAAEVCTDWQGEAEEWHKKFSEVKIVKEL